ncbi:chromate transporter [Reticulibacter mediterranei]|uniref:Chromate transporter n=1 Tax=Reticulibacter mediterranei TaxID=2778369 RepID=A0A8J3N5Y8_9CHLR|nr:chromate efflux transporter [Reticulibacter mediterranei]GHO95627.1 chromate transporter [Reticulibacter mediterranei]
MNDTSEQGSLPEENPSFDKVEHNKDAVRPGPPGSFWEVLLVFTRLGLTSFGGPIAHLGYFREEIVVRRKWVDEQNFADLLALCQFLPGPSSSQMGIALGMTRAGVWGGLAAWLGFTLPSAIALTIFAYITRGIHGITQEGWLHGLLVVAVAVVAQAVWGMAKTLCPDRPRATIAILAAIAILLWPVAIGQIMILAVGGLIGWRFLRTTESTKPAMLPLKVSRRLAVCCWGLFVVLLVGLPVLRLVIHVQGLALFDTFFRVGSLVFGGGHVVLPLLQREVVPAGWVNNDQFLAGYGAAQAVPGPLFTFSAYLGAVSSPAPNGWFGALIALVAMFLPSFFFVIGILPFWNHLRSIKSFQSTLRGINAAVVGILLAALYQPIWTSAIHAPVDFALGLLAFGLLVIWKVPPWIVVVLSALLGAGVSLL